MPKKEIHGHLTRDCPPQTRDKFVPCLAVWLISKRSNAFATRSSTLSPKIKITFLFKHSFRLTTERTLLSLSLQTGMLHKKNCQVTKSRLEWILWKFPVVFQHVFKQCLTRKRFQHQYITDNLSGESIGHRCDGLWLENPKHMRQIVSRFF